MADIGNLKSQDQPLNPAYIPPPTKDLIPGTKQPKAAAGAAGIQGSDAAVLEGLDETKDAGAVIDSYYADSITAGNVVAGNIQGGKHIANYLNNIPPPPNSSGSQFTPVSGTRGAGNPFLAPNPIVAFFITYNKIAKAFIELSQAQEQVILLQIGIANDLAKGKAAAIIQAGNAEYKSYIAAATASFTEAAVSLGQGVASYRASKRAESQLKTQSEQLDKDIETKKTKLNEARDEVDTHATNTQKLQARVNQYDEISNNAAKIKDDPTKSHEVRQKADEIHKEAQTKRQEVQNLVEKSNDQHFESRRNYRKAVDRLDEAQEAKNEFQIKYAEKRQAIIQQSTLNIQITGQFISKSIDGAANVVRAAAALEKSRAEALQALLSNYEQTNYKIWDTVASFRNDNLRLIADLFQQLRKHSDDAKKLGSSVAIQATG